MESQLLRKKFQQIGSDVIFGPLSETRFNNAPISVDVIKTKKGKEIFDIRKNDDNVKVEVMDIKPDFRHLLLLIRTPNGLSRFLCGHDETEYFVAAVPGPASNVAEAMEELKPGIVHTAQKRKGVKTKDKKKRKTGAYIRQGEWFFIPANPKIDTNLILKNEPLQRTQRSKPHIAEEAYRYGGNAVFTHPLAQGKIFTQAEVEKLVKTNFSYRRTAKEFAHRMVDAKVYVRGKIRHPDHKTIVLKTWHEVVPNLEQKAAGFDHLKFLD